MAIKLTYVAVFHMNLIASHQLYCLSFLTVSADSPKVMTESVKDLLCQRTSNIISSHVLRQNPSGN